MEAGRLIAERFELGEAVGSGGGGTVYRARDRARDAAVAVKLLHSTHDLDLERFEREARLLAAVSHPGVVRYLAHGVTGGRGYLVTEWVDGVTLQDLVRGRRVAPAQAVALLARLVEALAVVHAAGIVHRDLKPSNVLLAGADLARPVLLDFGVARLGAGMSLTHTGAIVGTPGYMAPEQARGERDLDARADVFALGCILYRCVTGVAPFAGAHPIAVLGATCLEDPTPASELAGEPLPAGLDELLESMLAKDKLLRPADARALAAPLARIARADATAPPPGSASPGEQAAGRIGYQTQRFVCIVAARNTERLSAPPGGPPSERVTLAESDEAPVAQLARYFGGRTVRLVDGTFLVVFTSTGYPADLAHRAATFALSLAARDARVALHITAGDAVVRAGAVAGRTTERAVLALGLTPPGRVRAEPGVARLLDDRFRLAPVDGGVFEFATEGRRAGEESWPALPFVGREREMDFLVSLLDECASESVARAALVLGAAGAGKSALRREFAREARRRHPGATVLFGQSDPFRRAALALLANALCRDAAGVEAADAASRFAHLAARVRATALPAPRAEQIARLFAAMAQLPAGRGAAGDEHDDPAISSLRGEPARMSAATLDAWLEWLQAQLAAAAPLVLLLEDVHWADPSSVAYVHRGLAALASSPLLVMGFGRPEARAAFAPRSQQRGLAVQELSLMPLGRAAAERVVTAAVGELSADELQAVLTLGAGNPFQLEELARAARADRQRPVPPTLLGMLQVSFDALSPDAARVLRAASVFGRAFQPAGVAFVLGVDATSPELAGWIAELDAHAMVRASGAGCAFRHDLIREAAYATLIDEDRRLAHRMAAEWLERSRDASLSFDPLEAAHHFEQAGEPARAAAWLARGAERARAAGQAAQALELVERALASGLVGEPRAHAELVRTEALHWLGRFELAADAARAALAQAARGGADWYRAATLLAQILLMGHDVDRALPHVHAIAEASPLPDAAPVWRLALLELVAGLAWTGRAELAQRLIERAQGGAADEAARDPGLAAAAARAQALLASCRGDEVAAAALLRKAIPLYKLAHDVHEGLLTRLSLARSLSKLGVADEVDTLIEDVLREAQRMAFAFVEATGSWARGLALCRAGRFAEAREAAARSYEIAHAAQMHGAGRARCIEAFAALRMRDLDAAEALVRAALADSPNVPTRCLAATVLAEVLLERGRPAEALAQLAQARALPPDPFDADRAWPAVLMARALEATGDREGAAAELRRAAGELAAAARALAGTEFAQSFAAIPAHAELRRMAAAYGVAVAAADGA